MEDYLGLASSLVGQSGNFLIKIVNNKVRSGIAAMHQPKSLSREQFHHLSLPTLLFSAKGGMKNVLLLVLYSLHFCGFFFHLCKNSLMYKRLKPEIRYCNLQLLAYLAILTIRQMTRKHSACI